MGNFETIRILVLDDDHAQLFLISRWLQKLMDENALTPVILMTAVSSRTFLHEMMILHHLM